MEIIENLIDRIIVGEDSLSIINELVAHRQRFALSGPSVNKDNGRTKDSKASHRAKRLSIIHKVKRDRSAKQTGKSLAGRDAHKAIGKLLTK